MKLPSSASLIDPRSARSGLSASAGYTGTRILPSNVHNANAATAMGDPPTYDEAVAKRNSTDVQSGANGPLHDFAPSPGYLRGKSKLFGLWEAEKWGQLRDAIGEFGNSPVTMESNFSTEKVDDVLDAIRTWISMAKLPPPTMNRGCPYSVSMDSAITAALKRLGSLYNDLQKYAGQMQTFDPPSRKHFVDLAKQIHAFIEDMK